MRPELFSQLLAASGGPKFLGLANLDKYLFSEFFNARQQPLHTLGASSGAWRLACLPQTDSNGAYDRLVEAYIGQAYQGRPRPTEVATKVKSIVSHLLGANGAAALMRHPKIHHHVVVCRARHLNRHPQPSLLLAGLLIAAVTNAIHRPWLAHSFDRVLVSPAGVNYPPFNRVADLPTTQTHYDQANLEQVLLATGSIPLVLAGVDAIKALPPGRYFDGGITDYHFKLDLGAATGLTLYPHFYPHMSPGWFDKSLPWRRHAKAFDRALVLAPTPEFTAKLPLGKLPDRTDFKHLDTATRQRYWQQAVAQSQQLADEFDQAIRRPDIAVTPLF
nr:alpha/beta hydrolase [Shewanella sp. NIFS-20-20]